MNSLDLTSDITIGENHSPFIVAEIGINHNGNLELAKEMIKMAKEIGVNAVKFQVKDVEEAHPKELLDMPYKGSNSFGKTYREHKLALEFSQNELREIYSYSRELDIPCFSTPCNVSAVCRLEELDNPFYKIASFFVTWDELLEEICKTKKPIIMSTGSSTIDEIDHAVDAKKYGWKKFKEMYEYEMNYQIGKGKDEYKDNKYEIKAEIEMLHEEKGYAIDFWDDVASGEPKVRG